MAWYSKKKKGGALVVTTKKRIQRKRRRFNRRRKYDTSVSRTLQANVAYGKLTLNLPLQEYKTLVATTGAGNYNTNFSIAVIQNGLAPWDPGFEVSLNNLYINRNVGRQFLAAESPYAQGIQSYLPYFKYYAVTSSKITFHVVASPSNYTPEFPTGGDDVGPEGRRISNWPLMASSGCFVISEDNYPITQERLDLLTNTQLINNKGFKTRYISTVGGNKSAVNISMARSTSKLSGIRDIRDNDDFRGAISAPTTPPLEITNPDRQNFYYLRISGTNPGYWLPPVGPADPVLVTPQISCGIAISLEMNVVFTGRRVWNILSEAPLTPPPPA